MHAAVKNGLLRPVVASLHRSWRRQVKRRRVGTARGCPLHSVSCLSRLDGVAFLVDQDPEALGIKNSNRDDAPSRSESTSGRRWTSLHGCWSAGPNRSESGPTTTTDGSRCTPPFRHGAARGREGGINNAHVVRNPPQAPVRGPTTRTRTAWTDRPNPDPAGGISPFSSPNGTSRTSRPRPRAVPESPWKANARGMMLPVHVAVSRYLNNMDLNNMDLVRTLSELAPEALLAPNLPGATSRCTWRCDTTLARWKSRGPFWSAVPNLSACQARAGGCPCTMPTPRASQP
jgi:hypothetical protein